MNSKPEQGPFNPSHDHASSVDAAAKDERIALNPGETGLAEVTGAELEKVAGGRGVIHNPPRQPYEGYIGGRSSYGPYSG